MGAFPRDTRPRWAYGSRRCGRRCRCRWTSCLRVRSFLESGEERGVRSARYGL
jgi:hypothetical protein